MRNLNEIKIEKSSILDGIEVKSATFIDKAFPFHFHQSWSLAYIEYGNENLSVANSQFTLNKNAVTLIPPYSIHKHWGNKNNPWSYKAIYLSNDVIKYVANQLKIDYEYLSSCSHFITYVDDVFKLDEMSIFEMLNTLFLDVVHDNDLPIISDKNSQSRFDEILDYLSLNYHESITLDKLEKRFKLNKFYLQKCFKKKVGLSPSEYLTAVRIENSKQLFYTDTPLVNIALESGFYDQSHFTHCFVKYVGVTPGVYKRNVKILQDQTYCNN